MNISRINSFLFITRQGIFTVTGPTNNNIQKQLKKYAKLFGINYINPHAFRRGLVKSLLEKGANIAIITKSLGHRAIAVTSRYLYLDKNEVADSLRRLL